MPKPDSIPNSSGPVPETIRGHVFDAMRTVIDPEIGINIVDLGLIYNVEVNHGHVYVAMTLTAPGCPAGQYLAECAGTAIERHVRDAVSVTVRIVWDPPWSFDRMSEAARQQLGWNRRKQ